MAKLFNSIEYRHGGLIELDLQYLELGPSAIASLGHLLLAVKYLTRLTIISDISSQKMSGMAATNSYELLGPTVV